MTKTGASWDTGFMRQGLTALVLFHLALAAGLVLGLAALPARAQESRLPPGPGRDQVIAACSDCHGLVALNGKHMNYGAWYAMIGDMMNNGASVPSDDREAIAEYLAANFGLESGADSSQDPARPAAK